MATITSTEQTPEQVEALDYPSEGEDTPADKSDVVYDPNAPPTRNKFSKGQWVSMTVSDSRGLRKEVLIIKKARGDITCKFWEYQLADTRGSIYANGDWFREKLLKRESQRQ